MKIFTKWKAISMASLMALNLSVVPLAAEWNPTVVVAGPDTIASADDSGPVLSVNALNNGVVVFRGPEPAFPFCGFCNNMYAASYTFGSGWGAPVLISDTSLIPVNIRVYINQADPDIMMNDSGYAVAVWEGARQVEEPDDFFVFDSIFSATRSSDGTWSPLQTVRSLTPTDFSPQNPVVAVNNSGLAVAVWNERRGPNDDVFVMASFLPFGGAWLPAVQLDATGVSGLNLAAAPDVEINDNGNVVAAWNVGNNSINAAIHAATYDPLTGLWTTVVLDPNPGVSGGGFPPRNVALGIDDNGDAVVSWVREVNLVEQIAVSSFTYGAGWSPFEILYSTVGGLSGPYVVMDHFGNATALWSNDFTGDVFSSRLPLGGTWIGPTLIATNGSLYHNGIQKVADVDDQGNVVVIIFNYENNAILQSILRTVQGGWQPPENIFNDNRPTTDHANIGIGSCGFALAYWDFFSDGQVEGQASDNFALANFLLAPANFVGTRCCQRFATQTVCISSLSWDPVDCALFYYIRRDGVLIATIPAGGSTTFNDPLPRNQTVTYTLSVVNIYGIESPGVSITLP